jgi:hypothetical protein
MRRSRDSAHVDIVSHDSMRSGVVIFLEFITKTELTFLSILFTILKKHFAVSQSFKDRSGDFSRITFHCWLLIRLLSSLACANGVFDGVTKNYVRKMTPPCGLPKRLAVSYQKIDRANARAAIKESRNRCQLQR